MNSAEAHMNQRIAILTAQVDALMAVVLALSRHCQSHPTVADTFGEYEEAIRDRSAKIGHIDPTHMQAALAQQQAFSDAVQAINTALLPELPMPDMPSSAPGPLQ